MTLINHILYWVLWHVLKGEEREKKGKKNVTIKITTYLLSKNIFLSRFTYKNSPSYKTIYWGEKWVK